MILHSIRDIQSTDASWIYEACQDEQIQYWTTIPKPYLPSHAEGFVRGEFPEYKVWVIEERDIGPVGVISIHSVDGSGSADIGYWVAQWGRGKGAAKNAIKLVAEYARTDPKIHSLAACISDENLPSQKVAVSAGLLRAESACHTCVAGERQTSASFYRVVL